MMLTSVPLRLGESVQTRPVLTHRSGSFCVSSPSRAVVVLVQRGRAARIKALQALPSSDHRGLGGPILDALTSQVHYLEDVGERSAAVFPPPWRTGSRSCGRQLLVVPVRGRCRQQCAPGSRGVAATVPSQGSCRGRRTGEGQCCGIGLLVADWQVGVCGGLSPGLVR